MLEHLSKITAIDPSAAAGAFDEMLSLVRGRLSDGFANVFPARKVHAFIAPISSCIIKQRKVDLVAHRGNVCLIEEKLNGSAPAIALHGLLLREGQHVVGCIANRAQDGPVLDREGLGQFLGEVRTRQRHAPYLGGLGREASLPRIRVCSGGHLLLGIRGLKS